MKRFAALLTLCAMGLLSSRALSGDIDPPADAMINGKPIATMKTLNQVEPRTVITNLNYAIPRPGSYYLMKSLAGQPGTCGIVITNDDVKIDLNGFALNGGPGTLDGILVIGEHNNISIRNGVLRGWERFGISATGAHDVVISDVRVMGSKWGGMYLGDNALVERCSVYGCGFGAPSNAIPLDDGIRTGSFSTVENCKLLGVSGCGIHVLSHSRIIGCTSCESSHAEGINAEDYCVVRDNTVARNMVNGIKVGSNCRVVDNTCGENGLNASAPPEMRAGIFVAGHDCLIEGNLVTKNYIGIRVAPTGGGNLIVRNSASGNTQQDYMPNTSKDFVGVVFFPSSGQTIDQVSPWANFKFKYQ